MANITYRVANPTAPNTTSVKGEPLLNTEIDGNFKSLDDGKFEKTGGTITGNTSIQGTLSVSSSISLNGNSVTYTAGDDNTATGTYYPALFITTAGNANDAVLKTASQKLSYAPSTGTLTSINFDSLSDKRYKTEISEIQGALEKIKKISGYTYKLLPQGDYQDPKVYAGVLAQETLEVMPEVVNGSEDTKYSVMYGNMLAFLVQAIKELDAKVESLNAYLAPVQVETPVETMKKRKPRAKE